MQMKDLEIFAIDSTPFDKTYEEWTTKWFQWLLSIPKDVNPATDQTGGNHAQNQAGEVWFLAGTTGGFARRACTIPSGRAIIFPVIAKECSFAEDSDLKTEEELIGRAREVMDHLNLIQVTIDTIHLDGIKNFRVSSKSCFDILYPENNIYGLKPGHTRSAYDGYWVFIRFLSVGYHQIHFRGEITFPEDSILVELARRYNKIQDNSFRTEVIYDLIVK
jgi:hypothetical protein